MSAREKQLAAAKVLVTLLSEDLPQATWTISEYGQVQLNGQIGLSSDPAETKLLRLQEWAVFLDADTVSTPYEKRTGGSASVTGYIDGVRVFVWAAFLKKDLPKTGGDSRD